MIKNSLLSLGEKLLKMILSVVFFSLLSRQLDQNDFGQYNYILAIFGLYSGLSKGGLQTTLTKLFVQHDQKQIFQLGLLARLIMSFLLLIVAIPTLLFLKTISLFNILILISIFFSVFDISEYLMEAQGTIDILSFQRVLYTICSFSFKFAGLILHQSLEYFLFLILIDGILFPIVYYRIIIFNLSSFKFSKEIFRKSKYIILKSVPLLISSLLVTLYMRMDQLMIKFFLGNESVANYSVGLKFSESLYIIPVVLVGIFTQTIFTKKKTELKDKEKTKYYSVLIWSSLLISSIIFFSKNILIDALFGSEYELSKSVLSVHIWSLIFVSVGVLQNRYLVFEGKEKIVFYKSIIGVVLNFVFNIIGIVSLGIVGAAYATLLSQMCANYFSDIVFKELRNDMNIKTIAFFSPKFKWNL